MKIADKEEKLLIVDENGKSTGKYENRSFIHSNGLWHNEVALWVLNKENNTVLFQRRSPNKRLLPNKLAICAGHVVADETIKESLFKEVSEEYGINLENYDVKELAITKSSIPGNSCFTYIFYIVANIPVENITIQEEEVAEVLYMDYDVFRKRLDANDEEFVFRNAGPEKVVFEKLDEIMK